MYDQRRVPVNREYIIDDERNKPQSDTVIDGVFKQYYQTKDGKNYLSHKGTVKNGKLNGPFTSFDSEGNVEDRRTYKDNKLEGTVETYYPDGAIAGRALYKDGRRYGLLETFHPNGQVECRAFMENDWAVPGSLVEHYNPKGKLVSVWCVGEDKGFGEVNFEINKRLAMISYWDEAKALVGIKRRTPEILAAQQINELKKEIVEIKDAVRPMELVNGKNQP